MIAIPAAFIPFWLRFLCFGQDPFGNYNLLLTPLGMFVGIYLDTYDWASFSAAHRAVKIGKIANILLAFLIIIKWLSYGSPSGDPKTKPVFFGPINGMSFLGIVLASLIFASLCKLAVEKEKQALPKLTGANP